MPGGCQNRRKNRCGMLVAAFWPRVRAKIALGSTPAMDLGAFWRHLADFGSHFGPNWVPKGIPKSHFWHQLRQKFEKMTPKSDPKIVCETTFLGLIFHMRFQIPLWAHFGPQGSILGHLGLIWGPQGTILGSFGPHVGP